MEIPLIKINTESGLSVADDVALYEKITDLGWQNDV